MHFTFGSPSKQSQALPMTSCSCGVKALSLVADAICEVLILCYLSSGSVLSIYTYDW